MTRSAIGRANPVDTFLSAVEGGRIASAEAFAEGAELDATVPNWRFTVRGDAGVRAELARWYGSPGRFEELRRTPIEGGEVIEFTLSWEENGIPHACHQIHVLTVVGDRISSDRVWCGGRWPAQLLAEMADAAGG